MLNKILDLFLHLDDHLNTLSGEYGNWIYVPLFLIIFCETGLVVTPFLPGDSLLFAAGALAARDTLNAELLFVLLSVAAIIGDAVNYASGRYLGERFFGRFLKPSHLEQTRRFYEVWGAKTIVLARFVPIVRTLAPFLAGVGEMRYRKFAAYNVFGGILWVGLFIYAGKFFGEIPLVKKNFTLVILGIIFVSILPPLIQLVQARRAARRSGSPQ